jgi:hypothetical protein
VISTLFGTFPSQKWSKLTDATPKRFGVDGSFPALVIKINPIHFIGIILAYHRQIIAADVNADDETKMVRFSRRSARIAHLKKQLRARLYARTLSLMEEDDSDDSDDDSDDEFRDELMLWSMYRDMRLIHRLKRARQSRYLTRSVYRRYGDTQFGEDIRDGQDAFLNDDEFLQKYRMNRSSFDKLVALIKDHPIFERFVIVEILLYYVLTPRQIGKRTTTSACTIPTPCFIAFSRNRRRWE